MKLLDRLRHALAAPAVVNGQVKYLSPYDDVNHLWPIVAPDWLPASSVTRSAAMQVPAIKRARGVICTTIARTPLRAYRGDELVTAAPAWLDRTDGPVSPYHRMVWTVDDLLFYGWSAWAVSRDVTGHVLAADRIPFDQWEIEDGRFIWTTAGGVRTEADPNTVILIPGSDNGLLSESSGMIRHAADLLAAASKAAENPAAYLELHQTNELEITPEKARDLVEAWAKARRGENGGVAFTSAGVEVREHGAYSEHLLVEGRNASALDIARAMQVPGITLDAAAENSMTYVNAQAKAHDLIDYGLAAYMSPIAARLGLDDVVARGVSIRFDLDALLGPGASHGTPDDGSGSTPPAPTEQGTSE